MSLFPFVAPFIVVAAVVATIWGIGSMLLAVRAAMEGDQATLAPVIVALVIAAIVTAGAFIVSAGGAKQQQR